MTHTKQSGKEDREAEIKSGEDLSEETPLPKIKKNFRIRGLKTKPLQPVSMIQEASHEGTTIFTENPEFDRY